MAIPSSSSTLFQCLYPTSQPCGCSETEKRDELMGVDIILFDDKAFFFTCDSVDTHASHRNVNRLDTFRHHRLKAGTLFTVSRFEDVSIVSPSFTLSSLSFLLSRSCSSWLISLLHLMI
ncbi:unnamed protein product [Brassica rapa subsp. trilocularis]